MRASRYILSLPLLCSLGVVCVTIWHATWAPFNMNQPSTRFAMEKKQGNLRKLQDPSSVGFNIDVNFSQDVSTNGLSMIVRIGRIITGGAGPSDGEIADGTTADTDAEGAQVSSKGKESAVVSKNTSKRNLAIVTGNAISSLFHEAVVREYIISDSDQITPYSTDSTYQVEIYIKADQHPEHIGFKLSDANTKVMLAQRKFVDSGEKVYVVPLPPGDYHIVMTDLEGEVMGQTPGKFEIYANGNKLIDGSDFESVSDIRQFKISSDGSKATVS